MISARTLTERLLATTSLAALIFAGASQQANATACTVVGAGASYTNSGSVACVAVTGSSVSITNAASGTIGPSNPAVEVTSTGTLTGGIVNSGHITTTSSGTSASAVAIEGFVKGGITNSGTISVASTGAAFIYGAIAIGTRFGAASASSFGGGITNSGTLSVSATGADNAQALLINISTFSGNISNTGTISTIVTNGDEGAGIYAEFATFNGSIINGGTISTAVTNNGGDVTAYGVYLSGNTFSGSIANSGTITATGIQGIDGSEYAHATGISIETSTLTGGIVNNGVISATATNHSTNDCGAAAAGIAIFGSLFTGGIVNNGSITATASAASCYAAARAITIQESIFRGGITNAGSIVASAAAGRNSACAAAIQVDGGSFAGGIANSGLISSTATFSGGDGIAEAYGVYLDNNTFSGGMTNSGTITATATTMVDEADAYAISATGGTFAGGIANSGLIASTATASGEGFADAYGVYLDNNTFSGGMTNSGTITATATTIVDQADAYAISATGGTFAGGIANSGLIASTATASGDGFAEAYSIYLDNNTFSGGMTNSGTITATANSALGPAIAYGVFVEGGTFGGSIANSGTITATANGHSGGSAIGIVISSTGFSGGIVNSGTIAGTMTSASGLGAGILIAQVGVGAKISNTGTIEGSTWAIDDQFASNAVTINQSGGSIVGGSGGAIDLSSYADVLNITGGAIDGNIVGNNNSANATVGNVINVALGSGTFDYANTISGVGVVNLQSGTLLLQNLTAAGISTTAYNQSAGSTLALEVENANNVAASLAASGTISLASGSTFQAFEGAFAWKPGTYTYADVIRGGAITGSFATVSSNSPFFTASLTESGTVPPVFVPAFTPLTGGMADSLTLTMLSPSQVPGLNGDQQSVANAIINIPGGNSTLDQLFELNSSQLGTALTQLSGSQYTQTNYQPLIDAWQTFTDTLSNRLAAGEGYDDPMDASYSPGSGMQFAQADIPQQVAQVSDGIAGMAGPQRWGAWMRGYGMSSSAQATATTTSFSESGAGLIAGADKQLTDQLVAGVAVNIATDKANNTGGGSTLTDAYQGSAYGQYQMSNDWYVNGIAGFGWQSYKSARLVTLVAPGVDNGSYDGQSYRLYGESGYTLRPAFLAPSNARVTPYVGLGYLHTHEGAFTENGPSALSVQAADQNSFTTVLGARATVTWQIGSTIFQPEIRGGWQHEWLDDTGTITAAFAQAPSSTFTATGTSLGRDYFVGGLGLTTAITASTQIFLDYDAKTNASYTAQAVSGGLRVDF